MSQGSALIFATQMQEQRAQVHILGCEKAADRLLKGDGDEGLKPKNLRQAQMLDSAMKKGANALVCATYFQKRQSMPSLTLRPLSQLTTGSPPSRLRTVVCSAYFLSNRLSIPKLTVSLSPVSGVQVSRRLCTA